MSAQHLDADLRIAVLMTCHNRRVTTLACLESVRTQTTDATLDIFLTDDGSTDGTAATVADRFPEVQVISGTGDLYWAAGMHRSQQAALGRTYDAHLWLNDDVILTSDALARLIATWRAATAATRGSVIVSGSVRDSDGRTSYGGVCRVDRRRPLRFELIEPGTRPREVDTVHGNVLLVPVELVHTIGGIDARFRHAMADFDLGLRARAAGASVILAPGWFGQCEPNPALGTFRDPTASFRSRLAHLRSQKGLPPREWLRFSRRHAGRGWPIYFISPYVRFLVSAVISPIRRLLGRP